MTRSILTRQQARELYDRSGSRMKGHPFYARPAITRLLEHGDFHKASAVVEFGCGAGTLAQQLIDHVLPIYASYAGFDLSEKMVQTTRQRLVRHGARVSVTRTDGRPRVPLPPHSCDRFVSTYVLDMLASPDIAKLLGQAWTVLRADGLLCLTSLTFGTTALSRLVIKAWNKLHEKRPELVGGSRPISLASFLGPASWKVLYATTVISRGVPSEVVIARPRARSGSEPGEHSPVSTRG